MRNDGRSADQLRPIKVTRGFTKTPAGSVLWEQGGTVLLCTASISRDLPPWMKEDKPGGWVTAEYVMLPASTPQRKPWPKIGHTDSRGTEIQRLIGRSLRAVVDLTKIGPHTIAVDCQVLEADGGTRTAAICGAYVALVDAVSKLPPELPKPPASGRTGMTAGDGAVVPARYDPRFYDPKNALPDQLAAVSVGVVDGEVRLDLDYFDDSRAEVDMNVAYTAAGKFVEVQGSAENGGGFDRGRMNEMFDIATRGCERLMAIQRQALEHR
ncbi:MAG TPA: ribonuclease PH [Tepidisphaeraceae bacterium]|jgi:ribonuclease PH|nr:ribonuclease PH [Tepidisphaeraceae bacterium]